MNLKISYPSVVLFALMLGIGCTSDDEAGGSFGSLQRSAELGGLDSDQSMALCDATTELRKDSTAEGDERRGGCLAEIFAEIRFALLNAESDPDSYSLDAVTEDCEAALERCMDDGPTVFPCTSVNFESSCHATVGDYAQCLQSAADVTATIASSDCETFVESEDERDRVTNILLDTLDGCSDELSACEGEIVPPPDDDRTWFEGGLDEIGKVETDASVADTSSNEVWLDELAGLVEGVGRPECDVALERDPDVDAAAALVAADPHSDELDLGLDTVAEWHWISADKLDTATMRLFAFLDEKREECRWVRYGVAVDGEPGEVRNAVAVLAE